VQVQLCSALFAVKSKNHILEAFGQASAKRNDRNAWSESNEANTARGERKSEIEIIPNQKSNSKSKIANHKVGS